MEKAEWDALRAKANAAADEQFASEVSDIISLTKKQVGDIITEASVDKKTFTELMTVIADATKSNKEKAVAIKNINGFAELAVALISKTM